MIDPKTYKLIVTDGGIPLYIFIYSTLQDIPKNTKTVDFEVTICGGNKIKFTVKRDSWLKKIFIKKPL